MPQLNSESIKQDIEKLKRNRPNNLIGVSNSEWYSLFRDEIRNSIAIEGIFTNRSELIDVLQHNKKTDKHKAASILGYFDSASAMYEYAANQYKEKEFSLRISDIKQIHTLLMRYEKDMGFYIGELGEFRKTRAEVTQSTFTPISEFYVRPVMELLIRWFNHHLDDNVYDPIELAALCHIWFETIHPYRDGNGRAGRILLSYILIGCGFVNIAIKGISKKDRDHYYQVLEKADDGFENLHREIEQGKKCGIGDVDSFIKPGTFDDAMALILDRLNDSTDRLKKIDISSINNEAELPLNDLARIYNYSKDYLRNLINRGRLKARKKGKIWYVRVKDMAAYAEKQEKG